MGCLFVLMFTGRSMAVPIRCKKSGFTATDVKTWIWTKSMQLSRVTGETMSDFVSINKTFYLRFSLDAATYIIVNLVILPHRETTKICWLVNFINVSFIQLQISIHETLKLRINKQNWPPKLAHSWPHAPVKLTWHSDIDNSIGFGSTTEQ